MAMRLTDFTSVDLTVELKRAGGFGVVYIGPDRLLGRWMALKTLRPELLRGRPHLRDLFLRECLTWVGLWLHPNLLTAQSATEIDGQTYLMLDYAEGGSLRDLLALDQPSNVRLAWAQMVAAGLATLHAPDPEFLRPHPLVHHDLKPENILVDEDGYAKVTDFGLAAAVAEGLVAGARNEAEVEETFSLVEALASQAAQSNQDESNGASRASWATRTARVAGDTSGLREVMPVAQGGVGTPAYMAPEQWDASGEVGTPADLYAFGLVLSELLAGRHGLADLEMPVGPEGWRRLHTEGVPRPLRGGPADGASRLPQEAEGLYLALLAKRPEDRPTAAQALTALQKVTAYLGEEPYVPSPNFFPRTAEHRAYKWGSWAGTCLRFDLLEEALDHNGRALALTPNNLIIVNQQGNILASMGNRARLAGDETEAGRRYEEALPWVDRALALASDDHERAIVMGMRAARFNDLRRYAEAETSYTRALALEPKDGLNWRNRALNTVQWAITEAGAGRGKEALHLFDLAEGSIREADRLLPDYQDTLMLLNAIQEARARLGK